MLTPLRRERAADNFISALKLVMDTVDDSIDQESDGRSIDETALQRRVVAEAAKFYHAPKRKQVVVEIARTITNKLSAVDLLLLGTGVCHRQRELMLQSLRNRICGASVKQVIEVQAAETLAASQRSYVDSPDWPDYLRTFAALLLIIAEIWEWFQ